MAARADSSLALRSTGSPGRAGRWQIEGSETGNNPASRSAGWPCCF